MLKPCSYKASCQQPKVSITRNPIVTTRKTQAKIEGNAGAAALWINVSLMLLEAQFVLNRILARKHENKPTSYWERMGFLDCVCYTNSIIILGRKVIDEILLSPLTNACLIIRKPSCYLVYLHVNSSISTDVL